MFFFICIQRTLIFVLIISSLQLFFFKFTSHVCCGNQCYYFFTKQLRLMTLAFKTEGVSCNTKAAAIVSHYSNLHIITMSSSVALFLNRCTQIICNNRSSYLLLGGKNNQHISDSCYIWFTLTCSQ